VNPKNKECIPSPEQKNPGLIVLMMNRIIPRKLAAIIAIVSLAAMAMSVLQPVLPLYLTSTGRCGSLYSRPVRTAQLRFGKCKLITTSYVSSVPF
jgi:hypothetical protein